MFSLQSGLNRADGAVLLELLTVGVQEFVWLPSQHVDVLCLAIGAHVVDSQVRLIPEPPPYFVQFADETTDAWCTAPAWAY